ncbi:PLP-dependent aminotransferase family protein [Eubacterium ruminantium]|uniref:MocR-like pyridoxine biosynthesis transcription factor PdxR n=1 Tax=Eubacterium ruminantium TaxID=42322 RepID=UPI001568F95A|nr:PLP-dependent aminotransferase family protein [Eubacterium ruminantium]
MLTYDLSNKTGPLYVYLYQSLKKDISEGRILPGTKLPSKRTFADNLGVSTITIENAYGQLESEGYIQSKPRKGYYVVDIPNFSIKKGKVKSKNKKSSVKETEDLFDISSNRADADSFPFSVWSKLMREVLAEKPHQLMDNSEKTGVYELRAAIADHLYSYRGMDIDPDQIIVGAGTEYLYGILVNLLGRDKIFCVENPGYMKPKLIYESNNVRCVYANMDDKGINVREIKDKKADVIHICPTHHFQTGITMPVSRRYELLTWANEKKGRYIIEDDYDSEFRVNGVPISPFFNIDSSEKVIYMNTFSKSLAPTIRISYMILPEHLLKKYKKELGFYSCTVPTFEQYTLASFISKGYFEKHINRMRIYYGKKRKALIESIEKNIPFEKYEIIENDSGLHFNMKLDINMTDKKFKDFLRGRGINVMAVSDYYMDDTMKDHHIFIINYSSIDIEKLSEMIKMLRHPDSK